MNLQVSLVRLYVRPSVVLLCNTRDTFSMLIDQVPAGGAQGYAAFTDFRKTDISVVGCVCL